MSKLTYIAELCQNHLGKEKYVDKMLERCAISGADIVKLQFIYSRNLSFRSQFENGLSNGKKILDIRRPYQAEFNRLKKLELPMSFYKKFIKRCKYFGVRPMITCFAREDLVKIQDLGFKNIKVASYDCGSFPMIREICKKFKNIFISTGATFDDEIKKTKLICQKFKVNPVFLHCVTIYPTLQKDFNLKRISFLKSLTKNVGYSDHSPATNNKKNFASMAAIYFGARYIERHITILEPNMTKDGIVSIKPEDIKKIKYFAQLEKSEMKRYLSENFNVDFKQIAGKQKRKLSDTELLNRNYYRGRFCSKIITNGQIRDLFNWEEKSF